MIPKEALEILSKHHYKVVGKHSAVKLCHWTKKSIVTKGERFCYKQKFYGIKSHRCLQMTPAVIFCTHRCLFCWRPVEYTIPKFIEDEDDPEFIVEHAIEAQRQLLAGYWGIRSKLDVSILKEAENPKHAAISLAGEPTIYSRISELIEAFHKRKMTTFLVTNGTLPERLESLEEEPTQLYISLCAPNEKIYEKLNRPIIKDGWERLNKSLELMKSFSCRTVIRITLVRDYNMCDEEQYAKLIEKAEPMFVECKAYMFVGFSRYRLQPSNMPRHEEVRRFAEKLADELDYEIRDEKMDSRVVLLARK